MAKKKLTPEEAAAKAAKPSAQEMSGGAVKPKPKPNAAAKGAAAMDDFVSGTKADGSYMTGAERKAAFNAARDTRFTMPNEPVVERSIVPVQKAESALVKAAQPAASAAPAVETGAAKMAAAAESAAAKGSMLRGLASPAVVVPALTAAADAVVPRADDKTSLGYDVNTTRDTATSAINAGALTAGAMQLLRLKDPRLMLGAAALAGGKALYDRLSDYHSANPEADNQPYALPNARANFWEQAPAAVSDAGRVASQILRGTGDGAAYILNNYTPYPYLRDANNAVANYITPESWKTGAQQPVTPEERASAQSKLDAAMTPGWRKAASPEDPEGKESFENAVIGTGNRGEGFELTPPTFSAPEMTRQLPSGQFEREIYGRDGQRRGFARGTQEQMDLLSQPSEFELQNRARQQVEDTIERNAIARMAQQEREFRERTSPEATQRFFDRVNAERELRDAMGRGRSSDPARNAMRIQEIKSAATRVAEATGKSVEEVLPEDSSSSNVRLAREILRTNPDMGLNQIAVQSFGMTPARPVNYYGDEVSYSDAVAEEGGTRAATAATASNQAETQARLGEKATQEADNAAARLQLAQERLEASIKENEAKEAAAKQEKELQFYRAYRQGQKDLSALVAKSGDMELNMDPEARAQHQQQIEAAQSALRALNEQAVAAGVDLGYVEPSSQPQANLTFNSVEEANAANLPKGTLITVAGRPARVD